MDESVFLKSLEEERNFYFFEEIFCIEDREDEIEELMSHNPHVQ